MARSALVKSGALTPLVKSGALTPLVKNGALRPFAKTALTQIPAASVIGNFGKKFSSF
jgi:hypothetical protein